MNESTSDRLDIYSYLDYRVFCRDFYHCQKQRDARFSFRSFAKDAGIAGSYLKHVIDGIRNISVSMSQRFGSAMGLDDKELEYFEILVRFNHAQSIDEKAQQLDRLRRKRARALKPLGLTDAVDLLSHWYVVAIKELVVNLNTIQAKTIQKLLRQKLTDSLIEKTIEHLIRLGWLYEEDGVWCSRASQIQFPDEVRSYVVRSFHRQMLEIAAEALDDELEIREFGAATFTFPRSEFPKLKAKIKDMQLELIGFVQDLNTGGTDGDRAVYHFGIQCFSLQRSEGKEHEN